MSDLLRIEALRPVAWARKHPDGTLTNELLPDGAIEACRTTSGAWEPLYTKAAAARALEHSRSVLDHNAELVALRNSLRAALEFIAAHNSSNWPERCQENVRAAREVLARCEPEVAP